MEEIVEYIANNGGFASMKELKEANFHTREITLLVKEKTIEKIKPGFYRLSDYGYFKDVNLSLITVCRAEPQAVICLISALDYYEMTDFNPSEIYYAIPHSQKKKSIATLIKYAEICQVKTVIMPILKGLVA